MVALLAEATAFASRKVFLKLSTVLRSGFGAPRETASPNAHASKINDAARHDASI